MGKRRQLVEARFESLEELRARGLQNPRVAQIVDVLGGTAEMHELERRLAGPCRRQLLTDVIFNSLDVVVGAGFDRFHRSGCVGIGLTRKLSRAGNHLRAEGVLRDPARLRA